MIEKVEIDQKICDGCGAIDHGYHAAAGHMTSAWSNIQGFDVCNLCELKLKEMCVEKTPVHKIEDFLLSIKMSRDDSIENIHLPEYSTTLINMENGR